MEGQAQKEWEEVNYGVQHFFRNKCNIILAELLVRDLKHCGFVKEALERKLEENMSLFRLLKNVNSRGKKKAMKKSKCTSDEPRNGTISSTQHINNLNDNEEALSSIQVCQLLSDKYYEEGTAIKYLSILDSAFLLCILTNDILEFRHPPDIKEALDDLRKIRNSIQHQDCYKNNLSYVSELLPRLCAKTKLLCDYLGKDNHCFWSDASYLESEYNNFSLIFREIQQENHKSHYDDIASKYANHHHNLRLTTKHLRRYSRIDETVENLKDFVAKSQVSVSEEPRPVLLCGARGSGKSFLLDSLALSIIREDDQHGSSSSSNRIFSLVIMVAYIQTKKKEKFWEHLYHHVAKICPVSVQKYGMEMVVKVLSMYSNQTNYLFLMDQNMHNTNQLNQLMPLMNRGTWVLSYQGMPETSTFYHLLKIEKLSEEQVYQLLQGITSSIDQCTSIFNMYKTCDYRSLIDTLDMAYIFAEVCLEMRDCVPFYSLIHRYIYKKINAMAESNTEGELIKLGKKAFDAIQKSKTYYQESSLADVNRSVWSLFLEPDQSKGFSFKYKVVEDYLAAKYVMSEPSVACKSWLSQARLFKRVFEIVCGLWDKQENELCNNLPYIRTYLEKLFEITTARRMGKKIKKARKDRHKVNDGAIEVENEKKEKNDRCDVNVEPMEVDKREKEREDKGEVHLEAMEVDQTKKHDYEYDDDDDDDMTAQKNFVRWQFLAKVAKDHQNNPDILHLLAILLACKDSWLFKCKSLSEKCVDSLSLVLRHVRLTKELTIKLVSGPQVKTLTRLWEELSAHPGVCSNTKVRVVIHHTDYNWITHEKLLAHFPAVVLRTKAPLYITKYVGPLLCSETEDFLKCPCMNKLDVLEAFVCDLGSLRQVLAHSERMRSAIVRLNLRQEKIYITNSITPIKLSSSLPLNLTITYFEGLQTLLDKIGQPHNLSSLRIYEVYMHEKFRLDLRRFTKLSFVSIRFFDMGRLPSIYLDDCQTEEKMEMEMEKERVRKERSDTGLPLERWMLHLVLNTYLPARLERLLLRNLSFCDDSNVHVLSRYWSGLPFQRVVFLDTHITMSMFRGILPNIVSDSQLEDMRRTMEKKFRLEEPSESQKNARKQKRLERELRESKRKNKPEGKEVIITSSAKLCRQCRLFSCSCIQRSINRCRETYQDFVALVNDMYSCKILSINYSSRDIVLRKDMCGDLQVHCPLAFLNDEMVQGLRSAQWHQENPEQSGVLGTLALAQAISLTHTWLSHDGALCLLDHLKTKKLQFGDIEPFRLTIYSRYYHTCPKSVEEMRHSAFTSRIKSDGALQQFNFRCNCMVCCHSFKKALNSNIFFNNVLLDK